MINKKSNLNNCKTINLPKIKNERGDLTFIEANNHIPFKIKRIYYIYNVPEGESRGNNAFKTLQKLIIAISGSFDIILDDGFNRKSFTLNKSNCGLYIPPMIWHKLENFSSGSVCLILVSEFYDEKSYIKDYLVFKKIIRNVKINGDLK